MTTERYERVQQRDAKRLRLEEDDETVPPFDCSAHASEITDDIETDDNVVHGSANMHSCRPSSVDVERLEKPLHCLQEELATIYGIPIFKAVCFQRKKFIQLGRRLSLRSHIDVFGQLAEGNFVKVLTISVMQFSIVAMSAVGI